MIKTALPFLCKHIRQVFDSILTSGTFPESWKEGIIIPIHKNESQLDPNNYRGITIGSCLGKLFCHVINNRISSDLENRCFLKQEQADFRRNYRTSDHVFVLKTKIDKYVLRSKNGSRLFGYFIDLKKAFDKVWHMFLKLQGSVVKFIYNIMK